MYIYKHDVHIIIYTHNNAQMQCNDLDIEYTIIMLLYCLILQDYMNDMIVEAQITN